MSGKLPFLKFFPNDWITDPGVRSVSLTARGLWIEMLCLMHLSPRRGYLQLSTGADVTAAQLARMTGCATDEADALLQELLTAGVCSRTEHGTIYSRRMVRDEQKRRACSEAGKIGGGNPTFKGHPKGRPKGDPKGVPKASEVQSSDVQNKRVSECADAGASDRPPGPDPIAMFATAACRALMPNERHAVAAAEAQKAQSPPAAIHGQLVPAQDLWVRCIGEIAPGKGFVFKTVTLALRYVESIYQRCVDEGVWPDEGKPANGQFASVSMTDGAVAAGIADGLARAEQRRNRR